MAEKTQKQKKEEKKIRGLKFGANKNALANEAKLNPGDGRYEMLKMGRALTNQIYSNPDGRREYAQVAADNLVNNSAHLGTTDSFDNANTNAYRHAEAYEARVGGTRRIVVGRLGNYRAVGADVKAPRQPDREFIALIPESENGALTGRVEMFVNGPSASRLRRSRGVRDFKEFSRVPDTGIPRGASARQVVDAIEGSRRPQFLPQPPSYQ